MGYTSSSGIKNDTYTHIVLTNKWQIEWCPCHRGQLDMFKYLQTHTLKYLPGIIREILGSEELWSQDLQEERIPKQWIGC